jgi:O-antigen/teichoic acid export membrane protein
MPVESARERIRAVGLNTGYQVGSQVAPAAAAIIAIPFLLRHMGAEVFGIMTLFSTALAYFTMLDLGLGRAATRFIAQSLEAHRPDDLRRYFWGSILLLNVIGIIATAAAMMAVPTVVTKLLKISPSYLRTASESFYVICLTIPVVTLMATFRGFLEASGRFPFISIVTACGGVGLYLLPVLTVSVGGGLVGVAVALALVRIAMCVALGAGCFLIEQRASLNPIFDITAIRRMLSFGGWLSVSNIVGTATIYADRFLLGVCVGMVAVSSYAVPLDVIGRLQILITSFCAVLFPLMSRLDGSASDEFHTVYRAAIATVLSLMTFIATAAALAAPALMRFWLGSRSTADSVFAAQVFLAGAVVQSMASIAWTALHARGRSDLTAWVHLAEFPVYGALFYLAATHYGVRGAALVWLGRGIVDFLCMIILLKRQRQADKSGIPPELVAAFVSVGILATVVLPRGRAAAMGALICGLTWLWAWRVLLDEDTRMRVVRGVLEVDSRLACSGIRR